jgi:DNA-binding response OmpR family regulator
MHQNTSGKKNILIVDDEQETRSLLKEILHESYYLDFAESGKDVFNSIARTKYDLIILDVNLSGINGYSISQKIVKNIANRPKILLFTVRDIDKEKDIFYKSGADAIIQKGIAIEEIKKAVDTLIYTQKPLLPSLEKPPYFEYAYDVTQDIKNDLRNAFHEIRKLSRNMEQIDQQIKWFVRDFLTEKQKILKTESSMAKLEKLAKQAKIAFYVLGFLILMIIAAIIMKFTRLI